MKYKLQMIKTALNHICVFLDIFKTFDNVWRDGLLFKLKTYGVEVTATGLEPTTT